VSERDNGQTDALIKGFSMATGEFFAWLNSDDTYQPGALQKAVDHFRDHPDTGLMYGNADYVDSSGTLIGSYRTKEFGLEKLASANIICQPAAFFRRGVFEAVGGLDETLDFAMDYDLWIKIGTRFTCKYIPQLLATYRLHETSKTIKSDTLIRNCDESLTVTIRHFNWAPITRVYTSCSIRCKARLPGISRMIQTAATIFCTMFRSLYLNRGIHRNDMKLLNRENFRKILKSRIEIMTGR
jgi:glycosyltransferase involved in cell wall biosynthesis